MRNKKSQSRRDFLKASAVSAAGITISGILPKGIYAKQGAWVNGMRINPLIDNLRVVSCKDQGMMPTLPTNWSNFVSVNSCINSEKVYANLDEMAKALAQKTTASEAWATIFQKPANKEFSSARVAFKVNCIEPRLMTCVAVINKIADELHKLGVPYENIIIYDGCHNAAGKYSQNNVPLSIIRQGIKVSNGNTMFGTANPNTISVPVPAPYNGNVACTAEIANGYIDILINTAVNKGHSAEYGGCTLSMKNHYGTLAPNPLHSYNGLIGCNKCDAILGGTPPRQQLVIIDSLAAIPSSNMGTPSKYPYRLVMGTFSPAVDYITAKRIRGTEMGNPPSADIEKILPDFGYTTQQRDSMTLIDVAPTSVGGWFSTNQGCKSNRIISFKIIKENGKSKTINITFFDEKIKEANIYNIQGKLVKNLLPKNFEQQSLIFWNGKNDFEDNIPKGYYVISLKGNNNLEKSTKFIFD